MESLNINIILTIASGLVFWAIPVFSDSTKIKLIAFGIGATIIFWVWLISFINHKDTEEKKMFGAEKQKVANGNSPITQQAINSPNTIQAVNSTVTIENSNSFKEPSNNIVMSLGAKLVALKELNPNKNINVMIWVEAGSSQRTKIAKILGNIMQQTGVGFFPLGNTFTGVFPDHPITILANSKNSEYVNGLIDAISHYISNIKGSSFIDYSQNFPEDFVKIYLNGTPMFSTNGEVSFE